MKITMVITGLGLGGAEVQVCHLADEFARRGHTVDIIALTGEIEQTPINKDIRIYSFKMKKNPISFMKVYRYVRALIIKHRPDVVHSHMFHANIFARLLRLTISFPKLVCTAHSTNEGGKLAMLTYRYTNYLASVNTNVSKEAVETFIAKGAVKKGEMIAVENGIDTNEFRPKGRDATLIEELALGDDCFHFIAVGRLVPPKDYHNMLRAFAHVALRHQHARLFIVGKGPLKEELECLAKELNIVDKVRFLGLRRDIPNLLNCSDALVLSSAYEGFGLVVAEAMACEKIVVATDSGGVKEVMGGHGLLAPIQDSPALAAQMLSVIEMPKAEREKIGQASRKHIVGNYSLRATSERWLDIYQRDKIYNEDS